MIDNMNDINKVKQKISMYEDRLRQEKEKQIISKTKLEQYNQEKTELIEELKAKNIDFNELDKLEADMNEKLCSILDEIEDLLQGKVKPKFNLSDNIDVDFDISDFNF